MSFVDFPPQGPEAETTLRPEEDYLVFRRTLLSIPQINSKSLTIWRLSQGNFYYQICIQTINHNEELAIL
jgi:hypothetical protein